MIGEILDAVLKECRALFDGTGATVILKTDFDSSNLLGYGMPLLLLDMPDGIDTGMYPGGVTHVDWQFAFNSYNYEPDAYVDDKSKYSTSLLNFIDEIRRHFSFEVWKTADMNAIRDQYGFRYTLSGITPADALIDGNGLIMGYKIVFDSIAIDTTTAAVQDSESVLEHVNQLGYPPTT
jgi:hypothetical protein